MKNTAIRYFLSLFVILLIGFSQLRAQRYVSCTCPKSQIKILDQSKVAYIAPVQKMQPFDVKFTLFQGGQEASVMDVARIEEFMEEEDESESFKHYLNINLSTLLGEALSLNGGFSSLISHKRYIIFQIFRI